MTDNTRSLWTTTLVLLGLGALVGGASLRSSLEIGVRDSVRVAGEGDRYVASRLAGAQVTESEYFFQLVQMLRRDFVDPVEEDHKLAVGAVRGMVGSLADPHSVFMNPDKFRSFKSSQAGVFEGIGVDVGYLFDQEQLERLRAGSNSIDVMMLIPDVVVQAVMPGSPAEEKGMRAGDRLVQVDGRWLITATEVRQLRKLQTQVRDGQADSQQLLDLQQTLRERSRNPITPARAREFVTTGTSGEVELVWVRGNERLTARLPKRKTEVKPVREATDGALELRFFQNAPEQLRRHVSNRDLILDLRNSSLGNPGAMRACLELLLPEGTYGKLTTERGNEVEFRVEPSVEELPRSVTLRVDSSVRGMAAVFVQVMRNHPSVRIEGELGSPDLFWFETRELPDGSGYTLVTGQFQPAGGAQ